MNFTDVMAAIRLEDNQARMQVTDDWLQGRTAYGGLQAALALRAIRSLVPKELILRSLQSIFIAPVPVGEAIATATVLRSGKTATHASATIVADGTLCFSAVGVFGNGRTSSVSVEPKAPPCRRTAETVERVPFIKGVSPNCTQHFELRWGEGQPPFSGAEQTNAKIYARYLDDDTVSEAHIIAITDIIPPPIISTLKQPAMVSSMNWQLEILRSAAELQGNLWYRFDADMTASRDGYCWQTAHIWSEQGDLAALSRQCVALFI